MASNRTIILQTNSLGDRYEEGIAANGNIYPGMILDLNSSGQLIPLGTAGKNTVTRVAIEDTFQGKTIDDAYASGAVVRYFIPQAGDLLNLKLLQNENLVIGDAVISNNAGKAIKTTGSPAKTLGQAEETQNPTAADGFIATRIQ